MDYEPLAREYAALLRELCRSCGVQRVNDELKRAHLLLLSLREREQVTPGELSRELGVTMPRTTAIINALEEKGYVTRARSIQDRRRECISITEAGRAFIEAKTETGIRRAAEVLSSLGEEDAAALIRIMKKLVLMKSP